MSKRNYLGGLLGENPLVPYDEHWDDVVLLMDGTDKEEDLSDSNQTVTETNTLPVLSNEVDPFGDTVDVLDFNRVVGTAISGIQVANSAIQFGISPFTIEMWVKVASTTDPQYLYSDRQSSGNFIVFRIENNGTLRFFRGVVGGNVQGSFSSTATLSTGTWHHVALTRDGSDLRMFLDGAEVATSSQSIVSFNSGTPPVLGYDPSSTDSADPYYSGQLAGQMAQVRVTKGVARYTAAFTPPDASFPTTSSPLRKTGVANLGELSSDGVSTTRPTRRWGGITGRSLVAASGNVPTTGVLSLAELYQSRFNAWDGLIEYLIIGGGGASGYNGGGGGGGGGVVTNFGGTPATMSGGSTHTITVGEGGGTVTYRYGGNSGISSIGADTALGGGGGGSRAGTTKSSGGSGGGGGHGRAGGDTRAGDVGTSGQGYAGGTGTADEGGSSAGGGGGGAGGSGGNASSKNGGNGGVGISSSITGTSTDYAGGGAGSGLDYNSFGGESGTASHGGGGQNTGTNGTGVDGKGGGGGGFGNATDTGSSGDASGGSGVVIIRMKQIGKLVKVSGTGSVPAPVIISGTDEHYYEFTTVGSITVQPA